MVQHNWTRLIWKEKLLLSLSRIKAGYYFHSNSYSLSTANRISDLFWIFNKLFLLVFFCLFNVQIGTDSTNGNDQHLTWVVSILPLFWRRNVLCDLLESRWLFFVQYLYSLLRLHDNNCQYNWWRIWAIWRESMISFWTYSISVHSIII